MYEKIALIVLMLLVITYSEEIFSAKDVKNTNFLNSRLSTALPDLYNDQHFTKDNLKGHLTKKSLFLLMPLPQPRGEHEKPKEMVQKTKRCSTLNRKTRFFSLPARKDSIRTKTTNPDRNNNVKISKQGSNAHTIIENAKYSQENSATSNRIEADTYNNKIFLRAVKDNSNTEDATMNLKCRERIKKCNTGKYICYCKDETCFPESSKESLLGMWNSLREDKPIQINHQKSTKHGNTRLNILQRLPTLYHKNFHELYYPHLINSFALRSQYDPNHERINNIPYLPVLYELTPNVSPHVVGNERRFVNVEFPFKDRLNFQVGSNIYNQYQPVIRKNSHICSPIPGGSSIESPSMLTILTSTNYADITTLTEAESNLEPYDSIGITEKHREHLLESNTITPNDHVGVSADSEKETNLYSIYSTDVTEESSTIDLSSLDKTMNKLKDPIEATEINQNDNIFKSTSFFTDYVGANSAPSITYPSIKHNEKFINMKECIKLFGRDVCVLSTTSPGMFTEQTQGNNINKYSTIRIPSVTQSSIEKGTTMVNYADELQVTDAYFELSTSGIKKSNADSNENLDSINTEVNDNDEVPLREFYQYAGSIEQTYESDKENKSFSTIENINVPLKKLTKNQTTDKTMETTRNKLLGKSKSHTTELLLNPNDKETSKSISDKKFVYSTISNDEEANNLKVDQQNWIINTNINSWKNTHHEEETTAINYDSKTEYNFEDQRDYLKETNVNIYSEEETLQEQHEKQFTTISYDFKTGYNFEEETTNGLMESRINIYPEEEIFQGQPKKVATISYDSKTGYNFEEKNTNDLKKSNTCIYSEEEFIQEQPKKKTTTNCLDFKIAYNSEGKTKNDLTEIKASTEKEIHREGFTTTQYPNYEKSNNLNNEKYIIDSLKAVTDSSTRKLPFCDNTLLLNSIRKVINDFAFDPRLTKTKDFEENILQMQGRSLLPEILQVSNLKSILLVPQIENTIVEKVKDVLSDVTAIPKGDFTNDWSHSVIKNTLRNILESLSGFQRKFPPMTVEEHQFKNGRWMTNLVTLAPISGSKLSIENQKNLRESIRDLLNSSAIASQANQYIVRNMIVQSVKNSLINDKDKKTIKRVDDSIIHALNDVLQTLNGSEDMDVMKENNEFVSNEEDMDTIFSQEMSTNGYQINVNDPILNGKQNLDKKEETEMDNERIQTISYQEAKTLENNVMITSEPPDLSKLYEEDKNIYIEEKTVTSSSVNKNIDNMRENIRNYESEDDYGTEKDIANQILNDKKNFVIEQNIKRDDNRMQTPDYQKAKTLENNVDISIVSEFPSLLESRAREEGKNTYIGEETLHKAIDKMRKKIRDQILDGMKKINVKDEEEKKLAEQPMIYHKAILQNSLSILTTSVEPNLTEAEELNGEENTKNIFSAATTISSTITEDFDGREKNTVDSISRIQDINIQNERQTENPDLWQHTMVYQSPFDLTRANELSDEHNATDSTEEYSSKYDEIDSTITWSNDNNELPLNYYSPEILKYIKNDHINDKSIEVTTINFIQETSPYCIQILDDTILENMAKTDTDKEMENTLNGKMYTTSVDDLISSEDVTYKNQESKIAVTSSIDEIDPAIILERIKYNLSPIKYYSPEILKYIKSHDTDNENIEVTTTSTNLLQETSPHYAQMSNDIISQNTIETTDAENETKYMLNEKTLTTSADNLISSINRNNNYYETKITPLTDKNILEMQQQNFMTKDDIVKTHEVTTEIQRTYAKTTYFKAMSSTDDIPKISSSLPIYEATSNANNNDGKNKNSNSSNDSNNLIDNKMNNIDNNTEANKLIVSSSKSSSLDDTYSVQSFPLSVASDISELQKSQLYYINDDVKFPLEIRKLKDGSYALYISKNICEQIIKRKCPCCVPLQGHVLQTKRNHDQEDIYTMTSRTMEENNQENIYISDVKLNYQSTQPSSTMTTAMSMKTLNILRTQKPKEEEEEKTSAHYLWKRNMNDDNLATMMMPVVDFVKKYNLLLDFNEEERPFNESKLHDKTQNYNKSLMKSTERFGYDLSEERNFDDKSEMKKSELLNENKDAIDKFQDLNIREKKNKTNFLKFPTSQKSLESGKNLIETELRKIEASQPEITQKSKLETEDTQNVDIKINSKNQERNPVLKTINISEEETEMKNKGIEWGKLTNVTKGNIFRKQRAFHKEKEREHEGIELVNEEQDVSKIKLRRISENNRGRPYRYQRNIVTNKRAELMKSILYWLKGLFVNK